MLTIHSVICFEDQVYDEINEMEVTVIRNTGVANQMNQHPMENDKPGVYFNVVEYDDCLEPEYDDCLEPESNKNNARPGPSGLHNRAVSPGSTIPETSSQSHYQPLQDPSYQGIVPKGGSLLPDIKVYDLARYIQLMLNKENALEEEFKVRSCIIT